jgi:hypothetical protein
MTFLTVSDQALGLTIPPNLLALADEVDRMRRREFMVGLGGVTVWPLAALDVELMHAVLTLRAAPSHPPRLVVRWRGG